MACVTCITYLAWLVSHVSQVIFLLLFSPCPPDGGPVEQVEQAEQHGKQNKEAEVRHCIVVFLPLGAVQLPQFHLQKYPRVLYESCKHKHYAGYQPGFYGSQAVSLKFIEI